MPVEEIVSRFGTFNRMFQFHHIDPKTKHKNYDNIIKRTISAEQIAEIDKCALLCRQCHGVIHAQNIEGTLEATIKIDNRNVSQKIKGWFIADNVDKTLTFVTNQKILLEPCVVKFGQNKDTLCSLEIDGEYLAKLLSHISQHKKIEVFSLLNNRLLCIESIKGKKVKVTQPLGGSFFAVDFKVEKGDCSYFWVRNGIMLTKEGEIRTEGVFTFEVNLAI